MPAVIVDSSVLITLAAGEQFHLLREFYSTIHIPPEFDGRRRTRVLVKIIGE